MHHRAPPSAQLSARAAQHSSPSHAAAAQAPVGAPPHAGRHHRQRTHPPPPSAVQRRALAGARAGERPSAARASDARAPSETPPPHRHLWAGVPWGGPRGRRTRQGAHPRAAATATHGLQPSRAIWNPTTHRRQSGGVGCGPTPGFAPRSQGSIGGHPERRRAHRARRVYTAPQCACPPARRPRGAAWAAEGAQPAVEAACLEGPGAEPPAGAGGTASPGPQRTHVACEPAASSEGVSEGGGGVHMPDSCRAHRRSARRRHMRVWARRPRATMRASSMPMST